MVGGYSYFPFASSPRLSSLLSFSHQNSNLLHLSLQPNPLRHNQLPLPANVPTPQTLWFPQRVQRLLLD